MNNRPALIVGLALFAGLIFSSADARQKLSLNIEKSVSLGLEHSTSLHSSFMNVQMAEARSGEMNASRLPSLKFGGSYSRLSDVPPFEQIIPAGTFGQPQPIDITLSPTVLNNYNLRLTLQQPLFTGFRVQSAYDIADRSASAVNEDFERDKKELVYTIKNAYWNLFRAREVKKFVDENVEQVKVHLDDVQHLLDQGMVTTNELLRVQVQLSNARLMQIDAKNAEHLAMLGLDNAIGLPLTTEIELETTSDSLRGSNGARTVMNVESLTETALKNRNEIKAFQYRIGAGEAGVKLAQSGWYPQVYLTGNYYYARPNQRILPAVDDFRDTWDVSVTMSFDVWNWGTTLHQTQQAEAQLAQAKDGLAQLRDAIVLEVTQNYLNVNQALERIGVSDSALQQATENYRVASEKFKFGLVLNSDMLDAEVALLQAKTNYTQAIVDYELAEARLQKSIAR